MSLLFWFDGSVSYTHRECLGYNPLFRTVSSRVQHTEVAIFSSYYDSQIPTDNPPFDISFHFDTKGILSSITNANYLLSYLRH